MIGFLAALAVVALGLLLIVWFGMRLLRFVVAFVDEYASSPRQRLVTWAMVPLALWTLVLALGFALDLAGFVASPSGAEVGDMVRAAALGALFAVAIAALHRAGRFEEQPPAAPSRWATGGCIAPVQPQPPAWHPVGQPRRPPYGPPA